MNNGQVGFSNTVYPQHSGDQLSQPSFLPSGSNGNREEVVMLDEPDQEDEGEEEEEEYYGENGDDPLNDGEPGKKNEDTVIVIDGSEHEEHEHHKKLSLEEIEELKLTTLFSVSVITKLHQMFIHADIEHRGTLTKEQILLMPFFLNNPLKMRIVEVLNFSDSTSFKDMVRGLRVFSKDFPTEDKLRFSFKLYDFDDDYFIGRKDMENFLRMIFDELMERNEISQEELDLILDNIFLESSEAKKTDGHISYDIFKKIVQYDNVGLHKINIDFDNL